MSDRLTVVPSGVIEVTLVGHLLDFTQIFESYLGEGFVTPRVPG